MAAFRDPVEPGKKSKMHVGVLMDNGDESIAA
jgi:hypothetical protein